MLKIFYKLPLDLQDKIANFICEDHTDICKDCSHYPEIRYFNFKMNECFICNSRICQFHSKESQFYAKKIYKSNYKDNIYLCQECFFFETNI